MSKRSIPKSYLGAFKQGHRRSVREFIDDEFSHKLLKDSKTCEESRRALDWLTQFNNEYHKGVIKRDDPLALHKDLRQRQEIRHRRYAASEDMHFILKIINDQGEES